MFNSVGDPRQNRGTPKILELGPHSGICRYCRMPYPAATRPTVRPSRCPTGLPTSPNWWNNMRPLLKRCGQTRKNWHEQDITSFVTAPHGTLQVRVGRFSIGRRGVPRSFCCHYLQVLVESLDCCLVKFAFKSQSGSISRLAIHGESHEGVVFTPSIV